MRKSDAAYVGYVEIGCDRPDILVASFSDVRPAALRRCVVESDAICFCWFGAPFMLSPIQISKRLKAASGYLDLEMAEEALAELEPIEIEGLRPLNWLRAAALIKLGHYESAERIYRDVLRKYPDDIQAAVGRAWCLKRLGRLDAAIRTLEKSVRLNPREAILQYNLACYHALSTDKARCLSRLGVAIRLDRSFATLVEEETDFDDIRDDADFSTLVQMAIVD